MKSYDIQEKIFEAICNQFFLYTSVSCKDELIKAYKFGREAHKHQKRDSGEPFFIHPLQTALILTEYKADIKTIIAAILHDTVEDVDRVSLSDIKREFGEEIAFLVDGVTKIETSLLFSLKDDDVKNIQSIESIRKMLEMAGNDLRVIVIKLADRLHNMRTLAGKTPEKQEKIAKETLSLFVPLSSRLSIWKLREELEKHSFPYAYPQEYTQITEFLERNSLLQQEIFETVKQQLLHADEKRHIEEIMMYHRGPIAYTFLHSSLENLSVNDMNVIQVIVDTEENCFLMLRLIHTLFKTLSRECDWITVPRDNGYRAYHTDVLLHQGYMMQFRIMTRDMYYRNNYGVAYDIFQKQVTPVTPFLLNFQYINERTEGSSKDFLSVARSDLFEDKIEVYYEGKQYFLPYNSTALDAAFIILDEKASFLEAVYVHDKKVPFDRFLGTGDRIYFLLSQKKTVQHNWLHIVKSGFARLCIQKNLQDEDYEKKIQLGKEILQKELDLSGSGNIDIIFSHNHKKLLESFSVEYLNNIFVLVAEGRIKTFEVFDVIFSSYTKRKKGFWKQVLHFIVEAKWVHSSWVFLRFKLSGMIEKEYDILKVFQKLRKKHHIYASSLYLKEDSDEKTFEMSANLKARNRQDFYTLLTTMEHKEGVLKIQPILSDSRIFYFLFLSFMALGMWFFTPYILYYEEMIFGKSILLHHFFFYGNLLPVFLVNIVILYYVRHLFSQIRSTYWVVFVSVFLNIFGVILFVFENYYSVSYYHRVFVFFLFLLMNYIFFSQFFVQKIRYSFLQQEINQKYTFTWKQYFLAVLCIFVLGINVVALKYFTLSSDVFFVMGLKSFGAFLFFAFLLFVKKFKNRSAKLFPVFSLLFYLTSISYVLNILFFVLGISFSSPVHAVLIQGFSSVFLLALYNKNKYAIFEKSRNLLILIAIMTALAFFLLVGNSRAFFPDSNCVGDAFQVISALFFASFVFFFSRLKKQTENTVPYQLWFTGIAALSFFLSPLSFSFSLENFLLIVTGFTASGVINYIWYSVLQTSSNKMLVIFRVHFLVFVAIIIDFIFFQREATLPLVMAHFFMIATVLLTELLYLDSKNTVKVSLS